jgi:glycosyltransferase involved in cell wall biosynthesis
MIVPEDMDLVSIVIPCHNPSAYLTEALVSARNQTYSEIEIILVDDGSDQPLSKIILGEEARRADVCVSQSHLGLPAARNAGIGAARGKYILPLDADDVLRPEYVATCLATLKEAPTAAFAYTAYEVFGTRRGIEQLEEYNLYRLLDRNVLPYAALIRKRDLENIGGYDESMRLGYEDWELWLRLGASQRFGAYVPQCLFRYRKHQPSLYDLARLHHAEISSYIQNKHPGLYAYEARARLKAFWAPAVTILSPAVSGRQSILDIDALEIKSARRLKEGPLAPAVLICESGSPDPHSAELAALCVWAGRTKYRLADGSLAVSRSVARKLREEGGKLGAPSTSPKRKHSPGFRVGGSLLWQHLDNAGLLTIDSWLNHPWRSVLRLIPLRLKERMERAAGRPLFDLSFYLQFQPNSLFIENALIPRLDYFPNPPDGRSRIALITPHLGLGGAEAVLLEIASGLSRERFEVLLLATQSGDNAWLEKWRGAVDHVYDIAALVPPERVCAAVFTIISNWKCETILLQNSLAGYAALPHIKRECPEAKVIDLSHSLDDRWDRISAVAEVETHIDVRIAACEEVSRRLLETGTPPEKIRLIRSGVDLHHFSAQPVRWTPKLLRILFAGRLDAVKRPSLLVKMAAHLAALRRRDFQFVVAGDGPEARALDRTTHRAGLSGVFEFLGRVDDMAPLFRTCDVCVLPSRAEGIPLFVLEALASSRPVIASNVGAISEVLDPNCGVLIDRGSDEARLFARAVNDLLDRPALREKMGAAGRSKVEAQYEIRRSREAYLSSVRG